MAMGNELFDQVIAFWQPFYPRQKLTREDARQMVETAGAVFDLLEQWSREPEGGDLDGRVRDYG